MPKEEKITDDELKNKSVETAEEEKNFPDFKMSESESDFPDFEKKEEHEARGHKLKEAVKSPIKTLQAFCEKKFGSDSKITKLVNKIKPKGEGDGHLDSLTNIKQQNTSIEKMNLALTIVLLVIVYIMWQSGPSLLKEADQLKNDIIEQGEVLVMEQKNNEFLEKLQKDRNTLMSNIHTVYAAVPDSDEKAEEVISMLENITAQNRMVIEAMSIREVPGSQFYYDDLEGIVQPYEYTFSVENSLPYVFSFIDALRSSLRLMDIMTLEIEEGKESYRANFSIYTYHLMES